MPRLLDRHLNEIDRLTPLALSLDMQLHGLSTAVMQLAPDAPAVSVMDMAELYDENGSIGVFRVTKVDEEVSGVCRVSLTHGLCTLRDGMMPAQTFMKPVRQALQAVLDCQPVPRWALGRVDVPEDMTLIFSTGYADGLTALTAMLDMLPEGYAPDFDQSVTPWLLHIRRLPDVPDCECRLSRNLRSLHIDRDARRFCTRVYPFGAETEGTRVSLLPIQGLDYAESELAAGYGVVSRTWHSDRIFDTATLYDVACLYLDRHGAPETTVTVDAYDLSQSTADDFDRFRLGKLCRLALPDMNLYLSARISAIAREDVYGEPGRAVLTLTNHQRRSRESDEIDELIRQVTAGKLLGGTVADIVSENRAEGSYQSPVVHYFTVEEWPDLLDVRVHFTPDAGVRVAEVRIDGSYPPVSEWQGGSFSAMPYLSRDALGRVARGQHQLVMHPYTASGTGAVSSTVTMTVIQKK